MIVISVVGAPMARRGHSEFLTQVPLSTIILPGAQLVTSAGTHLGKGFRVPGTIAAPPPCSIMT